MFENSKGFCLPHFGDLIETAENKLNDAQKKDFYAVAFPLMQENMERLQKEVSWFVEPEFNLPWSSRFYGAFLGCEGQI